MPGTKAAIIFKRQPDTPRLATRPWLRIALFLAVQLVSAQIPAPASTAISPRVQEQTFHSKALDRDMHYLAVLPADYGKSQQRYPVLYLLHGWAGDYTNWVKMTKLVDDSGRYPMIIITPDAQNSWYVNSATVPADRFEDYIINDLIHEVDIRWRTVASPNHRAIAGLSMGGYGSVLFGLKYPGTFAAVGSVSGAFGGPVGIEHVMPGLRESTDRAFGALGSTIRNDNDIDSLLYSVLAKADHVSIPYFFLECGSQDPLLPSNRKFVGELSSKNASYEYHEYPGAHTWEFWDQALPLMLEVISTRIVSGKRLLLPPR
jgi:putative tributyrin esterase